MAASCRNMLKIIPMLRIYLAAISLVIVPMANAKGPVSKLSLPTTIPMTTKFWTLIQPNDEITYFRAKPDVTFEKQEGIPQGLLVIKKGGARLTDVNFGDGTIEYDMRPIEQGDAAAIFRRYGHDSGELLYERVGPDCPIAQDCMQYAPIMNGNMLWDAYPQYQGPAPINPDGWNHFRIVFSGRRMNIFVNGALAPTLSVGHLESAAKKGYIELFGPATYANLHILPGAVGHLSPTPLRDAAASDRAYVRNWKVSPFTVLAAGADIHFGDKPVSSKQWTTITTEQNGAINLARLYKTPDPGQLRCVAWLTTDIDSSRVQQKMMSIGWLREVWVFVNGKLVFSGRNFWDPPGPKLTPDGRISLENGSFDMPLEPGHNHIDIAISNENSHSRTHFGWGLELKALDTSGITLPGPSGKKR